MIRSVTTPISGFQPYQSLNLLIVYPLKRNLFSWFPDYKFYFHLPIDIASGISIHFRPNKKSNIRSNSVNALLVRQLYIIQKIFVCGKGIIDPFIACSSELVSWSGGRDDCIIDIASYLKIGHTSTARIRGASIGVISTGVRSVVISTVVIPIQHIHIGDGNGTDSGNANNADNYTVLSSSSLYWRRTTKQTKEYILRRRVVCVKNKRVPGGSRECEIHHTNTTKALSQNFGAANHFFLKNLEGGSKSTKYTNIQSECVGNLAKIKLLEDCIMAFDMRYLFIISTLIDE